LQFGNHQANKTSVGRRFISGIPYVDLYNGNPFNRVCEFSEDNNEQLINLVRNQKVIIIGTVKLPGLELTDCTIITDLENYNIK